MKSIIKAFLFGMFLFVVVGVKAQEGQYEFATVKFVSPVYPNKGIYVSISGKAFEKIEIGKDEIKNTMQDDTPVLNYISEMTTKGWQVINVYPYLSNSNAVTFVLSRKK